MARMAAAGFWTPLWACARTLRRGQGGRCRLVAALVAAGTMVSGACHADPVKGEATLAASGGYARLVLTLTEDVDTEVSAAGAIIVIRFKRPVDIPVDKLSDSVPDYIG